jgi:selenocysteine-specific elongation factor
MAKLIGTAGHVDHGKTTLIHALTGIDADRLPEEKRRGMTIDVGFAYLDFPEIGRVSIVDVPGHEKFIHNMLVGAHAIDVALLCVSADAGVMPQTREHFEILRLLPVDQMVVAMTRADLADEDTRSLVQLDIEELLGGTRFEGSPIVSVSAISGEGLDVLRNQLWEALGRTVAAEDGHWYLPIDRVFGVKGHGCVVTGTLSQGTVKVGDQAVIEPGQIEVRVRSLHSHDNALQTSERGKRTAINLGGIKLEDVHRGMVVGAPGLRLLMPRWIG